MKTIYTSLFHELWKLKKTIRFSNGLCSSGSIIVGKRCAAFYPQFVSTSLNDGGKEPSWNFMFLTK